MESLKDIGTHPFEFTIAVLAILGAIKIIFEIVKLIFEIRTIGRELEHIPHSPPRVAGKDSTRQTTRKAKEPHKETKRITADDAPQPTKIVRKWPKLIWLSVLAVGCIGLGSVLGMPYVVPTLPPSAQLAKEASEALNDKDYEDVLAKAKECIAEFEAEADADQQELLGIGFPAPPVGKVTEEQKTAIHEHGLLNDVATCYFYKGKAYEGLHDTLKACKAYEKTIRYTYARTWDPHGWFWSPAKAAQARLTRLCNHSYAAGVHTSQYHTLFRRISL